MDIRYGLRTLARNPGFAAVAVLPAIHGGEDVKESFLLEMLGAVLGIALATWTSKLLLVMVSAGQEPLPLDVAPDSRVLLFTLLLSLATPLLFGMAPAWRAARVELNAQRHAALSPGIIPPVDRAS